MRHCLLRSQKRHPLPFRSSHILDPIPEGPDSVRVTFSRRSLNGCPWTCENRAQYMGLFPSVTCTEFERSSKTLNLVAKISNERKLLYNCDHTSVKKYRLHSVSGDSVFIESDSVHSAHVTATPFLSLIPPFLLRSCILPLRFCDPRWLHLYKRKKREMKLSGCTGD